MLLSSGYIAKYDTPSLILGVLLSGLVTSKLKPTARQLQAFSIFVSVLLGLSITGYIFYGCGTPGLSSDSLDGVNQCANSCTCADVKFSPVCGSDAVTYYSPCEAGCEAYDPVSKAFSNCSCVGDSSSASWGSAVDGPCKTEMCTYPFFFFIATQMTTNFLSACTWTTGTIISLRWVGPTGNRRSFALTWTSCFSFSGLWSPETRLFLCPCMRWWDQSWSSFRGP